MSAARHLHPGQLSMFIPAEKLVDPAHTEHGDQIVFPDLPTMKAEKLQEANKPRYQQQADPWGPRESLRESVTRQGVVNPVELNSYHMPKGGRPVLWDGHHRAFTANSINPKTEVPVTWLPTGRGLS